MEVLTLYMFNPSLERPEHITPGLLLGYMYTQTDRQKDRQTDRQTDTCTHTRARAHTRTNTQTHTQTYTHTNQAWNNTEVGLMESKVVHGLNKP